MKDERFTIVTGGSANSFLLMMIAPAALAINDKYILLVDRKILVILKEAGELVKKTCEEDITYLRKKKEFPKVITRRVVDMLTGLAQYQVQVTFPRKRPKIYTKHLKNFIRGFTQDLSSALTAANIPFGVNNNQYNFDNI